QRRSVMALRQSIGRDLRKLPVLEIAEVVVHRKFLWIKGHQTEVSVYRRLNHGLSVGSAWRDWQLLGLKTTVAGNPTLCDFLVRGVTLAIWRKSRFTPTTLPLALPIFHRRGLCDLAM